MCDVAINYLLYGSEYEDKNIQIFCNDDLWTEKDEVAMVCIIPQNSPVKQHLSAQTTHLDEQAAIV